MSKINNCLPYYSDNYRPANSFEFWAEAIPTSYEIRALYSESDKHILKTLVSGTLTPTPWSDLSSLWYSRTVKKSFIIRKKREKRGPTLKQLQKTLEREARSRERKEKREEALRLHLDIERKAREAKRLRKVERKTKTEELLGFSFKDLLNEVLKQSVKSGEKHD